jgi:hypothetical protein
MPYNEQVHGFCTEFYVVEKSIEVVVELAGETTRVRIDALRHEQNGSYKTKAYVEEAVVLELAYPSPDDDGKIPHRRYIWVDYLSLPWTNGDSADAVLSQALGFLRDACED